MKYLLFSLLFILSSCWGEKHYRSTMLVLNEDKRIVFISAENPVEFWVNDYLIYITKFPFSVPMSQGDRYSIGCTGNCKHRFE
jgi:hypothetical protein